MIEICLVDRHNVDRARNRHTVSCRTSCSENLADKQSGCIIIAIETPRHDLARPHNFLQIAGMLTWPLTSVEDSKRVEVRLSVHNIDSCVINPGDGQKISSRVYINTEAWSQLQLRMSARHVQQVKRQRRMSICSLSKDDLLLIGRPLRSCAIARIDLLTCRSAVEGLEELAINTYQLQFRNSVVTGNHKHPLTVVGKLRGLDMLILANDCHNGLPLHIKYIQHHLSINVMVIDDLWARPRLKRRHNRRTTAARSGTCCILSNAGKGWCRPRRRTRRRALRDRRR